MNHFSTHTRTVSLSLSPTIVNKNLLNITWITLVMADGIEVEQIMESRPKKVNILHHKTFFFGFLFSALKLHSASFCDMCVGTS